MVKSLREVGLHQALLSGPTGSVTGGGGRGDDGGEGRQLQST